MCSVAMAEGVHPIPFRTRQLSPPAPMVLRCSPWESRTSLNTSNGFRIPENGEPGSSEHGALSRLKGGRVPQALWSLIC